MSYNVKYKSPFGYCGEITDYLNEIFNEKQIYLFPPEELLEFEKPHHRGCKSVSFRKVGKTLGSIFLNKKGLIKDIVLYEKKDMENVIKSEWCGKNLIAYIFEGENIWFTQKLYQKKEKIV